MANRVRQSVLSNIVQDAVILKLPLTAAEELLEIIMRRYERASTLLTSNQTRGRLGQTARRQRRCHRHAGSLAASRTCSQVRPAQLAHQNRQSGRMRNDKSKSKRRMPGKERPAASRLVIQRPPTTEPHHRNAGKNTKPSAGQPIGQTAEGLDYRFLRSQPRVIGPGSLRKARPRRSEYNLNTHPERLENQAITATAQTAPCKRTLRQGKTITSSANPVGRF